MNNYLYIYIKDDCLRKKPLFILIVITLIFILVQKTEFKVLFKVLTFIIIINDFNLVIKFTVTDLKNIKDYIFHKWWYIIVKIKINFKSDSFSACLNTEYIINLIDYIFFYKQNL